MPMNEVTWLDIFSVDNFREIPNVRDNVSTALQSQYSHSLIYRGINKAIHDNVDACTILIMPLLKWQIRRRQKGCSLTGGVSV